MSDYVKKHGEVIPRETISIIAQRYHTILSIVNRVFWFTNSDTRHGLYVGSFGRGTAVDGSDVDILIELPLDDFRAFDHASYNGQSYLLQKVKDALLLTYPRSDIHADGQVVVINFRDGITFEILPAFQKVYQYGEESFLYPDTNRGGSWKRTDPKAEQSAMQTKNVQTNGLLLDTCKHIRQVHNEHFSSFTLSGIVIDSFVFENIGSWRWLSGTESGSLPGTFERTLLEKWNNMNLLFLCGFQTTIAAPGSGTKIELKKSIECLGKVLEFIAK